MASHTVYCAFTVTYNPTTKTMLEEKLKKYIKDFEQPKRKAISSRFPILVNPAVLVKKTARGIKNKLTLRKLRRTSRYLPTVVARHSSPLFRKLGEGNDRLQINKVANIKVAISKLDGLIIPPGKTFSFWYAVGNISKDLGYVDGMLLSNGRVIEGVGGGLCQLSNFLFWIFLHADVEVIERHHHSVDVFPDSGRTLPFGSGATIFSNYLDLKIKNISDKPLQIRLWLTETQLKGQLLSSSSCPRKFHISEKNHYFVEKNRKYFRYNEIIRETYEKGVKTDEQFVVTNFAPVLYPVTHEKLTGLGYKIIKI